MQRRILQQTRQDNAASHACDKAVSHLREAHNLINSLMVSGAEKVGKDIQALIRKVEKLKTETRRTDSERMDANPSLAQSSRVDDVKDKNIQYLEDLASRVTAQRRELSSIPFINPHVESELRDLHKVYSNFSHAIAAAIKDLKKK